MISSLTDYRLGFSYLVVRQLLYAIKSIIIRDTITHFSEMKNGIPELETGKSIQNFQI
jgi:hypothetical protein